LGGEDLMRVDGTNRRLRTRIGVALCGLASLAACGTSGQANAGGSSLTSTFAAIEGATRYASSTWGYEVTDVKTGKVLAAQNAQKMFDPGSTMKLYSVSAALHAYGPNYRFVTPVYRDGSVTAGTLNGNLVLVASGDMSFGLRE
jgi:D-alanyl-D-alanine carboxypeptidase/D-alanyl-D-alanine-endopeptidase (penicillin-binding protein 4)